MRRSRIRFWRLSLTQAKRIINILLWVAVIEAIIIASLVSRQKQAVPSPKVTAAVKSKSPAVPLEKASIIKPKVHIPAIVKPPVKKGIKVAIVIDDWGYNLENVEFLEKINAPFTLAVLPHLTYSTEIARIAKDNNKEVIIHMPMEPKLKNAPLEDNTIMTNMDDKEVKRLLDAAFVELPQARGISNHMGSKATSDVGLMSIIFEYMHRKNLYFLDSWTGSSVCRNLSRKKNLDFAKRDIFLDNENNPDYIRQQFKELIKKAKVNGRAIGIGHDRRNTFLVFDEMLAEFKKNNIQLVFVSDLIE